MLQTNQIYLGDCLSVMQEIDDKSVDLIVTSPPYFNAKSYSHWPTYENYLIWLENIFNQSFKILNDGRMCCVNLSVIIEPRLKRSCESKRIPLPFHFVSLMEKIGYKFLEDIIWVKPEGASKNRNGRFFQDRQPVQYKPNVINEYILIFQKPSKGLIDKIVRSYSGEIKENSLIKDGYDRTNIWHINPETSSRHPAPFPQELSDKLIKYYSYEHDVILDMFGGSGTTCFSAKNLNRRFIGIEKEEKYFNIAKERLNLC